MRAFELTGGFGFERLTMVERPVPLPGPKEVLVRMTAATLNYRDVLVVEGSYNPKQPLPHVPLSDAAGVVEAVGPEVQAFKPGDRVSPIFCQGWLDGEPTAQKLATALGAHLPGVLAEYRLFPEYGLLPLPDDLGDLEAACLPCAGLTAWSAVVKLGGVRPGDVVLIQGTGGVALFALQFAKILQARAIVTSSSNIKLERCKTLGADHLINYREHPEWARQAKTLTGGRGVDVVVEVGGAQTLDQSIRAVRVGGTVAMIGVLSGAAASAIPLPLIVMRQVRLQGVTLGSKADHAAMLNACEIGHLRPVLDDRIYPFESAADAFRHLRSGDHFGKVAIRFRSSEAQPIGSKP